MEHLPPFFPNKETFLAWIQGLPDIVPCHKDTCEICLADPYPSVEGPYYLAPEYLLLRVGPAASACYNVLVRVSSQEDADFRWYVARPDQDGETVFAAYLRDRQEPSKKPIGGVTIQEARVALDAFLAGKSGRRAPRQERKPHHETKATAPGSAS